MLCGKNREKWEGRQSLGVKPRTLLAWAASAVPLTHNSRMTTNLYFCLITSNFIHFQYEARCSEHLEWENHSAWFFFLMKKFSGQPLVEFWRHILSGCQVCDCGIPTVQYIQKIMRVGGHLVVMSQWQSTGSLSQRCPACALVWLLATVLCVPNREHFCKLQHASFEGMHFWVNKTMKCCVHYIIISDKIHV